MALLDKPKKNKLISFNIFLFAEGILRVDGRLRNHRTMPLTNKHPILHPKNHPVTFAVIKHFRLTSLHTGSEFVLSLIHQKFGSPMGGLLSKNRSENALDVPDCQHNP